MLLFSKAIRQVKPKVDICFDKSLFRNNTIKNIGVLVVLKYKNVKLCITVLSMGTNRNLSLYQV